VNARRNRITGIAPSGVPDAAQERRVLAMRVLDLTQNLVTLAARRDWPKVARLLTARRMLLDSLPCELPGGEEGECVRALRAAMAESDRTLWLLLAGAELHWPGDAAAPGGAGPGPRRVPPQLPGRSSDP